jgi:hypothetical protein
LFWLAIEKNKTNVLVISNKMVISLKYEKVTTFIWLSNQIKNIVVPFYIDSKIK